MKLEITSLIQMWCKFWSCIKAKLCNRSHSDTCLCAKIFLCHFTLKFCSLNPVASLLGEDDRSH